MGARWSPDAMPKRSPGSDKRSINPIDRIIQEHALQLRLCDMLEHIADGLPQKFDKGEIAEAGATYPCYCTPAELEVSRRTQAAAGRPLLRWCQPPGRPFSTPMARPPARAGTPS